MARPYGTVILNTIEEVEGEGVAYIYANNTGARAKVNLDKGLLDYLSKRTYTHNQTLNYFWNSLHGEYLHADIIAYYLGDADISKGKEILKTYIDKGYQIDHFENNNRGEADTRMDCRIENLHLVEQGHNKANYSTFYYFPYQFYSVMHKGCFGSYITDGTYETYRVYNNFQKYLEDRNYFYSNGLIKLLEENVKLFKEQPESEYRNNQLEILKRIIRMGNKKAETDTIEVNKLLEKYSITLQENETRATPDGHIISNVNGITPSKLKTDWVITEEPGIKEKLIQNIEDIYIQQL